MPNGGIACRRVLLSAEADLCNALGLSEAEYWYFVDLTDSYDGKRDEAYELARVPDVENGFLVPILINLIIGIAISAIGMLLAPKPKAIEQPTSAGTLKTADKTGARRFSSSSNFDSIQDLASLGETIPLVFTNRKDGVGGIRVNALLLWSQLLSYGTGQQLKALLLLSAGRLAADPEFAGMAIGDQTLKNYTAAKVGLYRRLNGGRIQEGDRYQEGTIEANPFGDVFTVYDDASESYKQWFCGNRSTSTQTQFGCFSPLPNGTPYKLTYELVMSQAASDGKLKADNNIKKEKLAKAWPTRAALTAASATSCVYTITGGQEDPEAYQPWGLEDVNNSTRDFRVQADDSLEIGSLYMAGTAQVVCVSSSSQEPWELKTDKTYQLKIVEPGVIETFDPVKTDNHSYGYVLQRLAIGTVANTRACHVTELGLKSTVFKQITGFPNVNSQPSAAVIADYENRNGNIQLGQNQGYVTRYSFFRLETRRLGSVGAWVDITGGTLFCVRGSSPQDRYNFLRIMQPYGQHEYRFVPVPGAEVIRRWIDQRVYLLSPGTITRYRAGDFTVSFAGQFYRLTKGRLTNGDWKVGSAATGGATVIDVTPRDDGGARPTYKQWVLAEAKYSLIGINRSVVVVSSSTIAYWNGSVVALGLQYRQGRRMGTDGGRPGNPAYEIQRWEYRDIDYAPTASATVAIDSTQEGKGCTLQAQQYSNGHVEWAVASGGDGYFSGDQATFTAFSKTYAVQVLTDEIKDLEESLNIYDAAKDISLYDAERSSHDDGPEHAIVYVNEIVRQDADIPQYDGLALLGLRLNATKEWSSFSQLSAYVKQGVEVERLIDDNGQPVTGIRGATNNFAEIAHALLTDDEIGAGRILGATAVSRERMTIAAQFCRANGFTWDGVIAQKLNLRSWIFEQAAYCLLDFTILGGQFSLVPSVPYAADYRIDNEAKPVIKALFTDGNIRGLKVAWLSPEERQLFKAVCKWRYETENGFSQERTMAMRLTDGHGGNDYDPEESFDLSGFCTSQLQAQVFAQYALMLRKTVDHGIVFETTPQSAMGLEPGQYFRFVSEATHTSRFNNGSINSEGFITSTTALADGTYDVLVWMPGTVGVGEALLGVKDGKALQPELFGQVFTIKNSTTTSRVYKLESLSYSSEGFVEVAGSYAPLTAEGTLATLDWQPGAFLADSF